MYTEPLTPSQRGDFYDALLIITYPVNGRRCVFCKPSAALTVGSWRREEVWQRQAINKRIRRNNKVAHSRAASSHLNAVMVCASCRRNLFVEQPRLVGCRSACI